MDERDDPVPVFGSWRNIYTAVIVCAVLVMAGVAVFARFPW
jgi:hypothetical protein